MVGWIIGAQGENVQSSDTFLKHDWIGNFKKRTARNSGLLVQFSNTKAWKLDHKDETWYTVFTYLEVVLDYLEVSLYCKFHYWGLLKYQICFNTVPHLKALIMCNLDNHWFSNANSFMYKYIWVFDINFYFGCVRVFIFAIFVFNLSIRCASEFALW